MPNPLLAIFDEIISKVSDDIHVPLSNLEAPLLKELNWKKLYKEELLNGY